MLILLLIAERRRKVSKRKSWYSKNSDYLHNCHLYAPISIKYSTVGVEVFNPSFPSLLSFYSFLFKDIMCALRKDFSEKFKDIESRIKDLKKLVDSPFESDRIILNKIIIINEKEKRNEFEFDYY